MSTEVLIGFEILRIILDLLVYIIGVSFQEVNSLSQTLIFCFHANVKSSKKVISNSSVDVNIINVI